MDRPYEDALAAAREMAPACAVGVVSLACRMAMTAATGRATAVFGLADALPLVGLSGLIILGGFRVGSRAVTTLGFGIALVIATLTDLPDATEAALHFGRGFPYADDALAAIDHALAFDWLAYARWMDGHPWLWTSSQLAYLSLPFLPLAVVLALSLTGSTERLATYFLVQTACLALVAIIAVFVPALGTYEHYRVGAAMLAHDDLVTADHMTRSLRWLRQDTLVGDGVDYHGLVSFPSYHAMSCVMNTWALWRSRWLRWPMAALSLLILVATPVQGSHYLIDIIAGIVIAAAAIWPSARLLAVLELRPRAAAPAPIALPA